MQLKVKSSNSILIPIGEVINILSYEKKLNIYNKDLDLIADLEYFKVEFIVCNPDKNETDIEVSGFFYYRNEWVQISFVCE